MFRSSALFRPALSHRALSHRATGFSDHSASSWRHREPQISARKRQTGLPLLRAFTLIELLVVITIIAILASLSMVALTSVRAGANSSRCGNNLRMCAMAVIAYTAEEEGLMPYKGSVGGWGGWVDVTSPYMDDLYDPSKTKGNNPYLCPFAARELGASWFGSMSFNYSMNWNVYAQWKGTNWHVTGPPIPTSRIRSNTVIMADGMLQSADKGKTVGFWDILSVSGNYYPPWPLADHSHLLISPVADATRPLIIRHANHVNQAHMDGHVSKVSGVWVKSDQTVAYTP